MKRFIDLRGQETGSLFAWYDTVRDEFECYNGSFDWSSWREFATDFDTHWGSTVAIQQATNGKEAIYKALQRYRPLLPSWVPIEEPTEEEWQKLVSLAPQFQLAGVSELALGFLGYERGTVSAVKAVQLLVERLRGLESELGCPVRDSRIKGLSEPVESIKCPVPNCSGFMFPNQPHFTDFVCSICGAKSTPDLVNKKIYQLPSSE